ncbi:MAG: transporter substrate-binding domain-containing protein [Rhodospirillales bacterium]|nr:transporter substrate-binding domain-containing protein [Rhodospirillales bacterium]MDE2198652.1 transporter substrate-binding domain-containing protein [Rhodospirillales bacterium]MDE2573846.1 transporter substrate-binding domain-containing protein [Rhodospirillales bacterium]
MQRRVFGAAALCVGLLGLAAWSPAHADALADIKARGTLIVGVKADYPPFGYRGPSGDIIGIEPDLAADTAKALGVKVSFVPVTASNRMQFLQQGKIDLMIATMSDTPEREKVIWIVKPDYYTSGYNLMLHDAAGVKTWPDVKGKTLCGIQGAYYNKSVAEQFGAQVSAFTGTAEALTALKQGRCIGFLYDNTAIQGQLVSGQWSGYSMPLETKDAVPWGLAVKLGETAFHDFMVKQVEGWHKSGLILQLETKYKIAHSPFAEEMHTKYGK